MVPPPVGRSAGPREEKNMSGTMSDRIPVERLQPLLESTLSERAVYFREYAGRRPLSDWNGKPIVGPPRRPFAELQMVDRLEREDWRAGWCFRAGQFISTWEPVRTVVDFPVEARALLERIRAKAGAKAGCWDVFAWKGGEPRFFELKRSGSSDRIRESQLRWRAAAEAVGVSASAFQQIEWLGGNLADYALTAMSRLNGEVRSWIRYCDGSFEFGGENPAEAEGWLNDYRRRTGLDGADLLWVLFRDNSGGVVSDWDIKQSKVRRK